MSRYVEERIRELSEEIRSYPTPIARCDLHLPALLVSKLKDIEEQPACTPEALWVNDGGFHAA